MNPIKLPPLPSHPEPMVMKWSTLELAALRARDLEVARVVLEAAAKECVKSRDFGDEYASPFVVIANAIRALEFHHAE